MRKLIIQSCCITAMLATSGLVAEAPSATTDPPPTTEIASINGQPFSLGLFRLFYAERLSQVRTENSPAFQNQVFNEFVNIVVTAQNAESKGLDKESNFQDALKLQRLQLLSRLALQDAANSLSPSKDALQKAYEKRYGTARRTEYKAQHILVKTEDEAKDLISQLDGGADFAELAKTHSLGPTGKTGGDLGWFDAKQMVQPFTDAVENMEPGTYSKSPVQTQFGWHVILLQETREADPPALETVEAELRAALQREALATYVSELREKADLKLNPELIKNDAELPDASQ
jgi:peptidyl-prolyl cis-trans isomerase C